MTSTAVGLASLMISCIFFGNSFSDWSSWSWISRGELGIDWEISNATLPFVLLKGFWLSCVQDITLVIGGSDLHLNATKCNRYTRNWPAVSEEVKQSHASFTTWTLYLSGSVRDHRSYAFSDPFFSHSVTAIVLFDGPSPELTHDPWRDARPIFRLN